jgi:hypothetical protein
VDLLRGFFHPIHSKTLLALYVAGVLFACLVLFLVLQLVPVPARRHVIRFVTFIGGLFYALEFFLPVAKSGPHADQNVLTPYTTAFGNISQAIVGFTIGLGVINLFQVHLGRLVKRASDAIFSLAFFLSFFAMFLVSLWHHSHPNALSRALNHILFDGLLQSLDATMFSLIAFYIASAAYRAFRVRSLEATILLVTALVVMLGQIPVGTYLTHTFPAPLRVENIRNWILTQANVAVIRAIAFGLDIGALAMSLRIWLGLERGNYFD